MDETRMSRKVYGVQTIARAGSGTKIKIGNVLNTGHVKSAHNQCACVNGLMNVDQLCLDHTQCRTVLSGDSSPGGI